MKIAVQLAIALMSVQACAAQSAQSNQTKWVYNGGKFNWNGDWSFAVVSVDYRDKEGRAPEGGFDLAMRVHKWGAWQPFVDGDCQNYRRRCFDTTPYKYLMFSAKSTVPHQVFQVGFMSAGDKSNGSIIMVTQFCSAGPDPEIGTWQQCKVPLSSFKLTDATILKFFIQDQTGLDNNKWYLDAVGFTAD
jgi:hypothetical protein